MRFIFDSGLGCSNYNLSILNRSVEFLFIVPDGYYGEISITKSNDATTDIPRINGKYVLDFSIKQNLIFKHEPALEMWMNIGIPIIHQI